MIGEYFPNYNSTVAVVLAPSHLFYQSQAYTQDSTQLFIFLATIFPIILFSSASYVLGITKYVFSFVSKPGHIWQDTKGLLCAQIQSKYIHLTYLTLFIQSPMEKTNLAEFLHSQKFTIFCLLRFNLENSKKD